MWVVLSGDGVGTTDMWDPEVMAPRYARDDRPTWYRQDDGTLKANVSEDVADALCAKYPNINPSDEDEDEDEDDTEDEDEDDSEDEDDTPADGDAVE